MQDGNGIGNGMSRCSALALVLLVECGQRPPPAPATPPPMVTERPSGSVASLLTTPPPATSEVAKPVVDDAQADGAPLHEGIQLGSKTPPGAATAPFAIYVNGMDKRIHPLFAESFLRSLDRFPPEHPLSDKGLVTRVEIILGTNGHLERVGIIKGSGVTAFDIGVLDSIFRAAPFDRPPVAILSTDGKVHVQWEFHRDPASSCNVFRE